MKDPAHANAGVPPLVESLRFPFPVSFDLVSEHANLPKQSNRISEVRSFAGNRQRQQDERVSQQQAPFFFRERRADSSKIHRVIFSIKPKKVKEFERILTEQIANGDSSEYGKYWTRQQIAAFLANEESMEYVTSLLNDQLGEAFEVRIVSYSAYKEYITVEAPLRVWENLLRAEFYEYRLVLDHEDEQSIRRASLQEEAQRQATTHPLRKYQQNSAEEETNTRDRTEERVDISTADDGDHGLGRTDARTDVLVRAEEYTIPSILRDHVNHVLYTVQFPAIEDAVILAKKTVNMNSELLRYRSSEGSEGGRDNDNNNNSSSEGLSSEREESELHEVADPANVLEQLDINSPEVALSSPLKTDRATSLLHTKVTLPLPTQGSENKISADDKSSHAIDALATVVSETDSNAALQEMTTTTARTTRTAATTRKLQTGTRFALPNLITQVYKVDSTTGSSAASVGFYEPYGHIFSPADLNAYQALLRTPLQDVANVIGNPANDSACAIAAGTLSAMEGTVISDCQQASIDVQYATSISQRTPVTVFHWNASVFISSSSSHSSSSSLLVGTAATSSRNKIAGSLLERDDVRTATIAPAGPHSALQPRSGDSSSTSSGPIQSETVESNSINLQNEPFSVVDWITFVANMADPPTVLSISFSMYEDSVPLSFADLFNIEALKLAAMGVTLVAPSGDDGAAGFRARNRALLCGYGPYFPASNPYVLAVGGTMGPELFESGERVCQSDLRGSITSGGGFSNLYARPGWQTTSIDAYFLTLSTAATKPTVIQNGFNQFGRAYPDISLMANRYLTQQGSELVVTSGTGGSAAVMAAFLSLINAERAAIGKSSVGWINNVLYAAFEEFKVSSFTTTTITTATTTSSADAAAPSKVERETVVKHESGDGNEEMEVDYEELYSMQRSRLEGEERGRAISKSQSSDKTDSVSSVWAQTFQEIGNFRQDKRRRTLRRLDDVNSLQQQQQQQQPIGRILQEQSSSSFFNDITSGDNRCVRAASVCCSQGFHATQGWDPVSGLGSIDFTKMKSYFLSLGDKINFPTSYPTARPPPPQRERTQPPTLSPIRSPTLSPTMAPTRQAGWVYMNTFAYNRSDQLSSICPEDGTEVKSKVVAVSGFRAGQCAKLFDAADQVIGSSYSLCFQDHIAVQYFSDIQCSESSKYLERQYSLGCRGVQGVGSLIRNLLLLSEQEQEQQGGGVFSQAIELKCTDDEAFDPSVSIGSVKLPLPLTDDAYIISSVYEDMVDCIADVPQSSFEGYLFSHCFNEQKLDTFTNTLTNISYRYQYPNYTQYTEFGCLASQESGIEILSPGCKDYVPDSFATPYEYYYVGSSGTAKRLSIQTGIVAQNSSNNSISARTIMIIVLLGACSLIFLGTIAGAFLYYWYYFVPRVQKEREEKENSPRKIVNVGVRRGSVNIDRGFHQGIIAAGSGSETGVLDAGFQNGADKQQPQPQQQQPSVVVDGEEFNYVSNVLAGSISSKIDGSNNNNDSSGQAYEGAALSLGSPLNRAGGGVVAGSVVGSPRKSNGSFRSSMRKKSTIAPEDSIPESGEEADGDFAGGVSGGGVMKEDQLAAPSKVVDSVQQQQQQQQQQESERPRPSVRHTVVRPSVLDTSTTGYYHETSSDFGLTSPPPSSTSSAPGSAGKSNKPFTPKRIDAQGNLVTNVVTVSPKSMEMGDDEARRAKPAVVQNNRRQQQKQSNKSEKSKKSKKSGKAKRGKKGKEEEGQVEERSESGSESESESGNSSGSSEEEDEEDVNLPIEGLSAAPSTGGTAATGVISELGDIEKNELDDAQWKEHQLQMQRQKQQQQHPLAEEEEERERYRHQQDNTKKSKKSKKALKDSRESKGNSASPSNAEFLSELEGLITDSKPERLSIIRTQKQQQQQQQQQQQIAETKAGAGLVSAGSSPWQKQGAQRDSQWRAAKADTDGLAIGAAVEKESVSKGKKGKLEDVEDDFLSDLQATLAGSLSAAGKSAPPSFASKDTKPQQQQQPHLQAPARVDGWASNGGGKAGWESGEKRGAAAGTGSRAREEQEEDDEEGDSSSSEDSMAGLMPSDFADI